MTQAEFNRLFIEHELRPMRAQLMRGGFIDQPMIREMYAGAIDRAARDGEITQRQAERFNLRKITARDL